MSKNWQIAWRNLWRNPRRTWITVAAVIMAVFFSTFMSSMQEGTYARMIDNMVKFYTGYIQIHHPGYWESKSINDCFESDSNLSRAILSSGITLSVPRIESFALVSSGENTKGCALIGIDPEKEDRLTGLSKWISQGRYLSQGDDGVLLAVNIARNLEVNIGDTLVLISQGYHGSSASALIPVRGILKFPSPQMNGLGAYIDLKLAGDFFGVRGRVTSIAMMVPDYRRVNPAALLLRRKLGSGYSVKTWNEMQPDLVKMIEGDRAGAVIMKGILYMVVGFGILGTIIMMMAERKKELGVLIAIGMHKFRLQQILCYESLCIGLLGVILGMAISMPLLAFMIHHPIQMTGKFAEVYESFGMEAVLYFSIIPRVFINQALTILFITLLIIAYPWLTIRRMNVIRALHGK
jgi:ABC-type lipoprotein release transport system permease subunit